jgi:predicted TIM-barrel fold metal-dependent hydrolase
VMGSDFPHGEGFANPREFEHLIDTLPVEDQRKIMWDNAQVLVDA